MPPLSRSRSQSRDGAMEVYSVADVTKLCAEQAATNTAAVVAVLIWAPWQAASVTLAQAIDTLAVEGGSRSVCFAKVNADACPELAAHFEADQVPFVTLLASATNARLSSVSGAKAAGNLRDLAEKAAAMAARAPPARAGLEATRHAGIVAESDDAAERLKRVITFSPVVLLMDGSKAAPRGEPASCALAILDKHGVEYSTYDLRTDAAVQEEAKKAGDEPLLYLNGKLCGNLDVMSSMDKAGKFSDAIPKNGKAPLSLEQRLRTLVRQAPVMLFMKGNPDMPQCGFSSSIIKILREQSVNFSTFDILSDEEVRQGLKDFSKWPTFPQLYAGGSLIGGLDIVKELADEGNLLDELSAATGVSA